MGTVIRAKRPEHLVALLVLSMLLPMTNVGVTSGNPAATPDPDPDVARTLGDLVERAERGWERVETHRTRRVMYARDDAGDGVSDATPSGAVVAVTLQEAIVPNRKRQRQAAEDAADYLETIVVDGRVFMRYSTAGEATPWREIDFTTVDPDSFLGIFLRELLMPVEAPLSFVPPSARNVPVARTSTVQVDGRSCDVYRISALLLVGAVVGDGVPFDLTVAIADDGLVCWTEQRSERFVTRTTLEMVNEPLTIEIPDDVARRSLATKDR